MSIAMGPVPSSPVATVTWHVVGLHGGERETSRLAGRSSGRSESSRNVKAGGRSEKKYSPARAQRSLLDFSKWY